MSHRGIRRESPKHAAEAKVRREVVDLVRRRDENRCRCRDLNDIAGMKALAAPAGSELRRSLDAFLALRCSGMLDVHEVIPRSAWRKGYLVAANCMLVCRTHHDWIDDEPDAAHELGLHGFSWEVPT